MAGERSQRFFVPIGQQEARFAGEGRLVRNAIKVILPRVLSVTYVPGTYSTVRYRTVLVPGTSSTYSTRTVYQYGMLCGMVPYVRYVLQKDLNVVHRSSAGGGWSNL